MMHVASKSTMGYTFATTLELRLVVSCERNPIVVSSVAKNHVGSQESSAHFYTLPMSHLDPGGTSYSTWPIHDYVDTLAQLQD